MRANFAGNSAPDIVEYGAGLAGLADLPVRYFDPLTEYLLEPNPYNVGTELEGMPWLKTFLDELMEQRMNSPEPGQYYSVTMAQGSERLFVNRNLLAKITGSSERVEDFEGLREVFRRTAAYAETQGRMIKPFSGSKDNTVWMMQFFMKGIMNQLSQRLDDHGLLSMPMWQTQWKYLHGEWDFHHAAFLDGFKLLSEIDQQMRPGYMGFLRDDAVRQFLGEEVLFLFAGTWDATTLRRLADFPVDVWRCPQPTPADPVVGKHMLGHYADGTSSTGIAFYLNKRSPHKEAAVDFLRFLTSYEGNKLFTDNSGWPPSVKTVPVAPEIASFISPEDGYMYYGPNFSIGGGTRDLFRKNLHFLTGPDGSAEALAQVLDEQMPPVVRSALAVHERSARWAVLPQDARIVALSGLLDSVPENESIAVKRQRLEAAQNLSEARALLIARQLELTADK